MPFETPAPADQFVDSIGVDTHFDYATSPYVTNWTAVGPALISSGIRHIRDGQLQLSSYGTRLSTLGAAGIKHSIGFDTQATAAQITQALGQQEPYVDFVESANEYDGTSATDPAWAAQLDAAQQLLFNTVRSSSANSPVNVLGPALARQWEYADLGNLDAYSNAGNLHNATCNENPGTTANFGIGSSTALIRASTSRPIWTTETGYNDDASRPCAIPDDVIAKYDPRTSAERFLAGEPRSYFYQFADMPSDPVFGGMGMVNALGVPKPQYRAMQSMIALLSDRGTAFAPTPLPYTLSGSIQSLHHLLLQKRAGAYVLMLWLELPSWQSTSTNKIGGTRVTVKPQLVTVTLSQPQRSASLFAYAPDWSLASTALPSNSSTYHVSVDDSISFVEF